MVFPSSDDVRGWAPGAVAVLSGILYKLIMGRVSGNEDDHKKLSKELSDYKNEVTMNFVGKPTLGEVKDEFRRDIAQIRADTNANHVETKATLATQSSMMNELRASITASIVNAVEQLERGVERRHNQNNAQVESLRKDIIELWKDRGK